MMTTQDPNLPLSRAEMAGMLGVAKETLAYYYRTGKIPAPAPLRHLRLLHRRRGAADRRVVGRAEEAHVQAGGKTMRRPELRRLPLESALAFLRKPGAGQCLITMSVGQWDKLLQGAYERAGRCWNSTTTRCRSPRTGGTTATGMGSPRRTDAGVQRDDEPRLTTSPRRNPPCRVRCRAGVFLAEGYCIRIS